MVRCKICNEKLGIIPNPMKMLDHLKTKHPKEYLKVIDTAFKWQKK